VIEKHISYVIEELLNMMNTRTPRFKTRTSAGRELGEALCEADIDADSVLAIPRGGLPLGHCVADALAVPLDVIVAQKISDPNNPEFAIGAVTADGNVWFNERALDQRDIDQAYIDRTRAMEAENARIKAERYRNGGNRPDLRNKVVVIVDDGIATGATARACIKAVQDDNPKQIVLAVPVRSRRAIDELSADVSDILCLKTPAQFRAVGQHYEQFNQVSDEEALSYLD
jgi:putative phosphoribosyl transferase